MIPASDINSVPNENFRGREFPFITVIFGCLLIALIITGGVYLYKSRIQGKGNAGQFNANVNKEYVRPTVDPQVESYLQEAMNMAKIDCLESGGDANLPPDNGFDQELISVLKTYIDNPIGLKGQFIPDTRCRIWSSSSFAVYKNKEGVMVLLEKSKDGIMKKELPSNE